MIEACGSGGTLTTAGFNHILQLIEQALGVEFGNNLISHLQIDLPCC